MPANVFAVTKWLSTEWLSFDDLLVRHELIGLAISAATVVMLFAQERVNSLCVLWLSTRVKLSLNAATKNAAVAGAEAPERRSSVATGITPHEHNGNGAPINAGLKF